MSKKYSKEKKQEVITASGIAQSQISPVLGFTPRQTVNKDEDGNIKDIGCIDEISFIIDITCDYSSLATSSTSINQIPEILEDIDQLPNA